MQEHWINPVAWSPKLVDHLVAMGWRAFQLDLEGGFFSEDSIAWIIDSVRAKSLELVVRVPADQAALARKLCKLGARRFLVPGVQSTDQLARYVDGLREADDSARVLPMVESLAWLERLPELAIEGVTGVHFGLVDLCRDLKIAAWRDVRQLPASVLDRAQSAAAHGLTVGSYMLPQWREADWPRHFDVLSYALPEFAERPMETRHD